MNITTGSAFNTIRSTSIDLFKKRWMSCILLALGGRVLSSGIQWYVETQLGLDDILTTMEQEVAQNMMGVVSGLEQGTPLGLETITALYGEGWTQLQPLLPSLGGIMVLYILVTLFLFMLLVYIVLEETCSTQTSWGEKITQAGKQLLPYLLTSLLLSAINLFFLGLFILPGIILGMYWIFTNTIALHQKKYFFQAMKESRSLVKGRWRRTFGVFLALLITGVLGITFLTSFTGYILGLLNIPLITTTGIQIVSSITSILLQMLFIVMYVRRYATTSTSPAPSHT